MPTLPPTPSPVLRCVLEHGSGSDTHIRTSLYFKYSGTVPDATACATIAGAIGSRWDTNLKAYMTSSGSLANVYVTDLASSTGATNFYPIASAGTRGGNQPTVAACVIGSHKVARRYRGGKPRSYFPYGIASDVSGEAFWDSTFLGNLSTSYGTFITAVGSIVVTGTNVLTPCNVSYYHGFTVVTNPITHRARNVPTIRATPLVDDITGTSFDKRIGTQRRRIKAS